LGGFWAECFSFATESVTLESSFEDAGCVSPAGREQTSRGLQTTFLVLVISLCCT